MAAPDSPDSPDTPPATAEEVARLEEEVARLKASMGEPPTTGRHGWWRPVVAGLLVFIAALLAPLSVLSTWANGQIQDTDRYVATVAPLASDPAVQAAVTARLEEVIFSYLDLDKLTTELVTALEGRGLPTGRRHDPGGARRTAGDRGQELRQRPDRSSSSRRTPSSRPGSRPTGPRTRSSWRRSPGRPTAPWRSTAARSASNLAVLINTVKKQLSDAGFAIADRIPEVSATFTILQSEDLGKVQTLIGLIDDLSTWLPAVCIGLLVIAVLIARDRRRMVLVSGLAVAASMLLLGATLNVLRPIYLDALPASSSAAAAGAVYDQLVSFIRLALRGVLVVALTVAIVAWFSARSGPGASARAGLVGALGAMRRGTARAGPADRTVRGGARDVQGTDPARRGGHRGRRVPGAGPSHGEHGPGLRGADGRRARTPGGAGRRAGAGRRGRGRRLRLAPGSARGRGQLAREELQGRLGLRLLLGREVDAPLGQVGPGPGRDLEGVRRRALRRQLEDAGAVGVGPELRNESAGEVRTVRTSASAPGSDPWSSGRRARCRPGAIEV